MELQLLQCTHWKYVLSEGDINLVSKVILLVQRSEPTKAIATGHLFYICHLCCSVTLATLKDGSISL